MCPLCIKLKHWVGFVGAALWLTSGTAAWGYFQDAVGGVRPAGMGDAFVSVADDANAVLYNPAGFARLHDFELTSLYADLYHDLNARLYTGQTDQLGYNFISLALPGPETLGTFGVSWNHFYSVLYKENTFTASYGRTLFAPGILDIGVTAKVLQWMVEANDYSSNSASFPGEREKMSFTLDGGLLCTPVQGLTLGLSANNLLPARMGLNGTSTVPLVLRAGAAFKKEWQDNAVDSVQLVLEWEQREALSYAKVGLETWFFGKKLGIRAGYNFDQITTGLGFHYNPDGSPLDLQVDYAFAYPLQIVETLGSHRMGMTFRWRSNPAKKTPPVIASEIREDPADECYEHALRAYYLEEWETSAYWWKKLLEIEPDNLVAKKYLDDIREKLRAAGAAKQPVAEGYVKGGNLYLKKAAAYEPDPGRLSLRLTSVATKYPEPQVSRENEVRKYAGQAEALERTGHPAQALEVWELVQALDEQNTLAGSRVQAIKSKMRAQLASQFELGVRDFNARDYVSALSQFRAVLKLSPQDRQAAFYLDKTRSILSARVVKHYQTAVANLEKHNYTSAIEYFKLVQAIHPNYHRSREFVRQAEAKLKALAETRAAYRAAKQAFKNAELTTVLKLLAPLMQRDIYDFPLAKLFNQAIKKRALAVRLLRQGEQAYAAQDYDGAIAAFTACQQQDRDGGARALLVQALIQKGILEYRKNNFPEALAAWEQAEPLQSDNALVKLYIQRTRNKIEYYKKNMGEKYFDRE